MVLSLTSEDSWGVIGEAHRIKAAQEILNFRVNATVLCGWSEICKISRDVLGHQQAWLVSTLTGSAG